jgi:hypothetical protein
MRKYILLIFMSILGISTSVHQASASSISIKADSEQPVYSQAEIEQILSPVALYPDSVLTHLLIASTYPLDVIQAHRWVSENNQLSPETIQKRLDSKNWEPSVKALVPFPNILERLNDDLEWTERLGNAFLQDEELVLASIQSLRQKADEIGSLDNMENMKISREENNIIIQPVQREYVYIPYYDTRIVYGNWHWRHHPPIYWSHHHYFNHHHHYNRSRLFFWHPRVRVSLLSTPLCAFHWRNRHLLRVEQLHHWHLHNHHSIIRHANARRWQHNSLRHRVNGIRKPIRVQQRRERIGRIQSGLSLQKPRIQNRSSQNQIRGNKPVIRSKPMRNGRPAIQNKPAQNKPAARLKPGRAQKPSAKPLRVSPRVRGKIDAKPQRNIIKPKPRVKPSVKPRSKIERPRVKQKPKVGKQRV